MQSDVKAPPQESFAILTLRANLREAKRKRDDISSDRYRLGLEIARLDQDERVNEQDIAELESAIETLLARQPR